MRTPAGAFAPVNLPPARRVVNRQRHTLVVVRLRTYGTAEQLTQTIQRLESEIRLQGFDIDPLGVVSPIATS